MIASRFSIEDQNSEITEAELASLRWRAIEAANSAEGLSAVARRVLVAMICKMNGKTRECYPSELWLASFLGVHLQSVKKAKAELRDKHKLILWENPGGPRHQSRYLFNWEKIIRLSEEAKSQARDAVDERRSRKAAYGSPQTTNHSSAIGSPQATNEEPTATSKVASRLFQGSQIAPQGSLQATPKVASRLPDHSSINPYRSTLVHHASSGAAQQGRAPEAGEGQTATRSLVASKGACEEGSPRDAGAMRYPKLFAAFEDSPDLQEALKRLDADRQFEASKLLTMKGKTVAAEFVARAVA